MSDSDNFQLCLGHETPSGDGSGLQAWCERYPACRRHRAITSEPLDSIRNVNGRVCRAGEFNAWVPVE